MSDCLFHLTTKDNLIKILRDELLKASIPRVANKESYPVKMVCFTESPPFALDFFRYRWSHYRDGINLLYGIGFNKEHLAQNIGVKPVFYTDKELTTKITLLKENLEKQSQDNELIKDISEVITEIWQHRCPLQEDKYFQGFTWEREWRICKDFKFNYNDIKVICCPNEDREEILEILGNAANNVAFLSTWQEYDEMINFINGRSEINFASIDIEQLIYNKKHIDKLISLLSSRQQNYNVQIPRLQEIYNNVETQVAQRQEEIKNATLKRTICDYTATEILDKEEHIELLLRFLEGEDVNNSQATDFCNLVAECILDKGMEYIFNNLAICKWLSKEENSFDQNRPKFIVYLGTVTSALRNGWYQNPEQAGQKIKPEELIAQCDILMPEIREEIINRAERLLNSWV
ncbi:hypothetical protein NON20_02985 [Synechocystis sp. B12]|nr:hypothetical protein NON20_02985 [Synechocystis sp. B12]